MKQFHADQENPDNIKERQQRLLKLKEEKADPTIMSIQELAYFHGVKLEEILLSIPNGKQ